MSPWVSSSCCRSAAAAGQATVVVEAAQLRPLPNYADPLQLSMMTINPPTAALLLSEFVTLAPGDWVIQNAANSAGGPVPGATGPIPRLSNRQRRSPPGSGGGRARHRRRHCPRRRRGSGCKGRSTRPTERRSTSVSTRWADPPADASPNRCARARRGQLRPHERRAVRNHPRRFRLPRPDPTRILARELVSAYARGPTPCARRRARRTHRAGKPCTRRSTPPTTSARSKKQWQAPRAESDRERSSSSRNRELEAERDSFHPRAASMPA